MMPSMDDAPPPVQASAPLAPTARLPMRIWLREGLRAGFFLQPRVAGEQPMPLQVAAFLLIFSLLEISLARFEVAGAAHFDLRGWLAPWWSTGALVLLAWWVLPPAEPGKPSRPAGLAAWFVLWMCAVLPANTVSQLLGIAQAHDMLPQLLENSEAAAWALYLLLLAWTVGTVLRLTARFGAAAPRLRALAIGMVGLFALAAAQFPDRPWQAAAAAQRPRLELSQEVFETQQALWQKTIAGIAPERAGTVDVYALVFSPDAGEDVFLRESSMVTALLAQRFDAGQRIIHLVNHARAAQTHPWATRLNLERAIESLAARMDREHDVLVVYLTSHGAADFKLSAANEPLKVDPVSPADLRRAFDQAGIRNRVVAVSACYSGGWIAPLASETTLVMTAADAGHTSYGCGRLSELTFFGRAVFDEQLRRTHSFEQAFAAAVPVIRQREVEAGKDDGFSNPQISVGEKIRPVLQELERRLANPAAPGAQANPGLSLVR
jgi:peptidase C13-like protein